jgi:hypothetical protein
MLTRRESGARTDLYYTLRRDQGLDQDTDAIRCRIFRIVWLVSVARGSKPANRVPLCRQPEACAARTVARHHRQH